MWSPKPPIRVLSLLAQAQSALALKGSRRTRNKPLAVIDVDSATEEAVLAVHRTYIVIVIHYSTSTFVISKSKESHAGRDCH